MKYIKTFEKLFYEYEDDKLKIYHSKDRIIVSIASKGRTPYPQELFWSKYSILAGCVRLLGTNYENSPKIREIQIKPEKVVISTIDAVFRNFLSKLGYRDKDDLFSGVVKDLRINFGDFVQKILNNSKNIGEVMNDLKEVQELVGPYLDSKKYNL